MPQDRGQASGLGVFSNVFGTRKTSLFGALAPSLALEKRVAMPVAAITAAENGYLVS